MNKNLEKVLEEIAKDEELTEDFSKLDDMDEMYDYCDGLGGGYTEEEFDDGISETIDALCYQGRRTTLSDEELDYIAGGMNLSGLFSKTAVVMLSALTMGSAVLPFNAKAADVSPGLGSASAVSSTKADYEGAWSKTKKSLSNFWKSYKKVIIGVTIATLAVAGIAVIVRSRREKAASIAPEARREAEKPEAAKAESSAPEARREAEHPKSNKSESLAPEARREADEAENTRVTVETKRKKSKEAIMIEKIRRSSDEEEVAKLVAAENNPGEALVVWQPSPLEKAAQEAEAEKAHQAKEKEGNDRRVADANRQAAKVESPAPEARRETKETKAASPIPEEDGFNLGEEIGEGDLTESPDTAPQEKQSVSRAHQIIEGEVSASDVRKATSASGRGMMESLRNTIEKSRQGEQAMAAQPDEETQDESLAKHDAVVGWVSGAQRQAQDEEKRKKNIAKEAADFRERDRQRVEELRKQKSEEEARNAKELERKEAAEAEAKQKADKAETERRVNEARRKAEEERAAKLESERKARIEQQNAQDRAFRVEEARKKEQLKQDELKKKEDELLALKKKADDKQKAEKAQQVAQERVRKYKEAQEEQKKEKAEAQEKQQAQKKINEEKARQAQQAAQERSAQYSAEHLTPAQQKKEQAEKKKKDMLKGLEIAKAAKKVEAIHQAGNKKGSSEATVKKVSGSRVAQARKDAEEVESAHKSARDTKSGDYSSDSRYYPHTELQ